MNNEIEFDHFKDINDLLKNIDSWYREDDIEYTRWFGLTDLYNLKIYITFLQQKVEQLENIRKETIEYMKEFIFEPLLINEDRKLIMFNENLKNFENILNKGDNNVKDKR